MYEAVQMCIRDRESTTETQENTTEAEKNTDFVNNDSPEAVSTHKRPNLKQLPKAKKDESASTVLMKYLVEKKAKEEMNPPAARDPTDIFLESIAGKIKRFTPYYRNIAESRIFNLVQQLELEQILPTHQHSHAPSQQFQQQQTQYTSSNSYTFQNDVPANQSSRRIPPPTSSPATSNSTAASYTATFSYDDSNFENTN